MKPLLKQCSIMSHEGDKCHVRHSIDSANLVAEAEWPSGNSVMFAAFGTDVHGFERQLEPRPEPLPMLMDISLGMWIIKAGLPC